MKGLSGGSCPCLRKCGHSCPIRKEASADCDGGLVKRDGAQIGLTERSYEYGNRRGVGFCRLSREVWSRRGAPKLEPITSARPFSFPSSESLPLSPPPRLSSSHQSELDFRGRRSPPLQLCGLRAMGLDEDFLRERLGVTDAPARPVRRARAHDMAALPGRPGFRSCEQSARPFERFGLGWGKNARARAFACPGAIALLRNISVESSEV